MDAGLHLIRETEKRHCEELLERYYRFYDVNTDQHQLRNELQAELRDLCGELELPINGSLTFIIRSLPFGVAYPELPSTHLFRYPDLGINVINGFAAEQKLSRGTNIAVLVDPSKVKAPEIDAAADLLTKRRIFVRGYSGRTATVRHVSDMVENFPYDLIIFATHCGDADGWRWTYKYEDSEGIQRTLVVDIAIGISNTDDPDMFEVMEYSRFVSLNGVDWSDPVAKEKLYVGTAIEDYANRDKDDPKWEPVKKEVISRVVGSAALAMADNNYIAMPRSLACEGSPIVTNNASVSWHELAGRFMFANARAYVSTLIPVADIEAEAIAKQLIDKHYGKPIAHAVWASQRNTYGKSSNRTPYIAMGVYPQRLRSSQEDVPARILHQLVTAINDWTQRLENTFGDEKLTRNIQNVLSYYKREAAAFRKRWF